MTASATRQARSILVGMIFGASIFSGCKTSNRQMGAEAKGLSVSPNDRNIALIMTGMNNDEFDELDGYRAAHSLRQSLEALAPGSKFEVRELHHQTKENLLAQTIRAANDVGANGTLVWYVGTHGWTDGFTMDQGGRVYAQDVERALRSGRKGLQPIKRLIMMFDYCGAAGVVGELNLTGEGARARPATGHGEVLNLATASASELEGVNQVPSGRAMLELMNKLAEHLNAAQAEVETDSSDAIRAGPQAPVYAQALFLSPVTRTQETEGTTLTWAIDRVIKQNVLANPDMTIGAFLKETARVIATVQAMDFYSSGDEDFVWAPQELVFRALPNDDILKDSLFRPGALAPATP